MRKYYFIAAFILVAILALGLPSHLRNYRAEKWGKVVYVRLLKVPATYQPKNRHWVDFTYKGKVYNVLLRWGKVQYLQPGQVYPLKHVEGTDTFVSLDSNTERQFFAMGIVLLVALVLLVKGLRYREDGPTRRNSHRQTTY
jgi:hypothetical protein